MKKTLKVFLLILWTASVTFAQETVSRDDYEKATQFLSANTRSLVYNSAVSPNWIDKNQFWYRVSTKEGTKYVLVNAKNGKKSVYDSLGEIPQAKSSSRIPRRSRTQVFSPDGTKIAYIKDWNLWMSDIKSGEEIYVIKNIKLDSLQQCRNFFPNLFSLRS